MRKTICYFLVSIMVTVPPARSEADVAAGDLATLALIGIVLYSMTALQGQIETREPAKIHLLRPLENGQKIVTPERAVEIIKGAGDPVSSVIRTMVADSVMVQIMTQRYWLDFSSHFGSFRGPDRVISHYALQKLCQQAFETAGLRFSSVRKNIVQQFAEVVYFEMSLRGLGVEVSPTRNRVLAAYYLVLGASVRKEKAEKRERFLNGLNRTLRENAPEVFASVAEVIASPQVEGQVREFQRQLDFLSARYWTPFQIGMYAGMGSAVLSVIGFIMNDIEIMSYLQSFGMSATRVEMIAPITSFFGIPIFSGFAGGLLYRKVLSRILKPQLSRQRLHEVREACAAALEGEKD